jgi:hypothetical protein
MEELELDFEQESYQRYVSGQDNLETFLHEVFTEEKSGFEEDRSNRQAICYYLLRYHSSGAGSPSIEDFSLTEATYKRRKEAGVVKINFDVHLWYGCDDKTKIKESHENVIFKINEADNKLTLLFPELLTRSTDGEFD